MKYTLRTLLCLLLALCMALPMVSCGGKYNDSLSAAKLCDSITAELATEDGWRAASESYISPSSWGEDYTDYLDKVAEYRIVVAENADMNIDEVGVFLCKSEKDAKDVKTFCENYLATKSLQLTPLLESYNPHELHKLDYAAVTVLGRYVVYTILSPANTASAETAMEKALTPAE